MWCFVNWRPAQDDDGNEPDLPDNVGFHVRGPAKGDSTWCLCEVFDTDSDDDQADFEWVSEELEILLESAKGYPPAFVLAFSEADRKWPVSKSEYSALLIDLLRKYLGRQEKDVFILAEAVNEDFGYLARGEFAWVLHYYPETEDVLWISGDLYMYRNSVNDFRLTPEQLQRLAVVEKSRE